MHNKIIYQNPIPSILLHQIIENCVTVCLIPSTNTVEMTKSLQSDKVPFDLFCFWSWFFFYLKKIDDLFVLDVNTKKIEILCQL